MQEIWKYLLRKCKPVFNVVLQNEALNALASLGTEELNRIAKGEVSKDGDDREKVGDDRDKVEDEEPQASGTQSSGAAMVRNFFSAVFA